MGKSAPKTQTITNKTELPAWVDQGGQANYQLATDIAGQLPGAYQGNIVAGMDALMPALQYAQGLAGQQTPWMQNAQYGAATAGNYNPMNVQAGSFLTGDVNAYMNPYLQNVEQQALSRLDDQRLQALNRTGDQAIAANAFGGSRQGVMEGVTNAEAARAAGDLSANIRSAGFNQAQQAMQADQNRQLQGDLANQQAGLSANQQQMQAAMMSGQLASMAQGMGYNDAASLMGIGEQFRNYEQQLLAQDAARFDANKAAMLEPLNLRLSALGMSPYGQTSTQTRDGFTTGGSPISGALGGAATGASIFSALGGAAAMGPLAPLFLLGGAALGGFGSSSDENEKTNKKMLGRDAMTGLPIYAYDYKSDVAAAKKRGQPMPPKRVGPMAQDIEKKMPGMVGEIGGKKVVKNLGFGGLR
jgi:hypothetical protein